MFGVNKVRVQKYLNSSLPFGHVTLKYCFHEALPHLHRCLKSLIIHETKIKIYSQSVFECDYLSVLLAIFSVLINLMFVYLLAYYLYYTLGIFTNCWTMFSVCQIGSCSSSQTLPKIIFKEITIKLKRRVSSSALKQIQCWFFESSPYFFPFGWLKNSFSWVKTSLL